MNEQARRCIEEGRAVLGIEFGSTRIKAVLIDEKYVPIASGSHDWENRLENGIWTYHLDDIWGGLQDCYQNLLKDVQAQYGVVIHKLAGLGFSAMMHGYMPFNQAGELLVPFRTWRNTMTGEASAKLTEAFQFHIPQRWSIAHLYQAMLNNEEHVKDITFLTTLAGYIHWKLSGEKVLGIGEASGMFPIDSSKKQYREDMLVTFDRMAAESGAAWKLEEILPKVLLCGEDAGTLTEEGAKLLDISGNLSPGVPMCPPEGDAGTGMTATNAVTVRTGNVSAGTSVFAMVVLEENLKALHEELDMVTTPGGDAVAMVHCNNCTSDLNAWTGLFGEVLSVFGASVDANTLYETLFHKAMEGEADCGGLLGYNYYSGEHISGFEEGRPLLVRKPDSIFNLANFMRMQLYTSLGALKLGLDILLKEEQVAVDRICGHGGLFKTEGVGQSVLAAAMNAPVMVMKTAGEGGAWGMALLAAYRNQKAVMKDEYALDTFLAEQVFAGETGSIRYPEPEMVAGFERFMEHYRKGLAIEKAAVEAM